MPASPREWTLEMVHALPDDGNRYELIDGELLVSPAPSYLHQFAIARLYDILEPYCDSIGVDVIFAPAAVTFSERREVQPDLFAPPRPGGRQARRFEDVRALFLAVEVLSPSTLRADRYKKKELFRSEGVPDYWIVDPVARLVERWRPSSKEPDVIMDALTFAPVADREALTIDLPRYFARVHRD